MTPIPHTDHHRWTPPTAEPHRVRHLCRRFGLSEPAARFLAPLVFGEGRA